MEQIGYYTLPNGRKLHFSINAWYNLEQDAGLSPQAYLEEFGNEAGKEEPNEFLLLDLITDLVYAALKAYDQEEGNEIDYNRFKVRSELVQMDGEELAGLNNAMLSNSSIDTSLGKRKVVK